MMYSLFILVCITLMSSSTYAATNTPQVQLTASPSSWAAAPGEVMQFAITAEFADGTKRDVTEECSFFTHDDKVVDEAIGEKTVGRPGGTIINGAVVATGPGSSKLEVSWFPSGISDFTNKERTPRSAVTFIPVTVSAKDVVVPDLAGKTESEADDLLSSLNLKLSTIYASLPDDNFASETIVSQNPVSGSKVIERAEISAVVNPYARPSIGIRVAPVKSTYQVGDMIEFFQDVQNLNFNNAYTFKWSVDGKPVGIGDTFKHTFMKSGRHYVQLISESSDPKENDAIIKNILVEYPPDMEVAIGFSPEKTSYEVSSTVKFEAKTKNLNGVTEYRWYVAGEYIGSGAKGVKHKFKEQGEYEIKLGLRMGSNFDELKETRTLIVGVAAIGKLGRARNRFEARGAPENLIVRSSYWVGGSGNWSKSTTINGGSVGTVKAHIMYDGEQADGWNTGFLVYAPKGRDELRFTVFHFVWSDDAGRRPHGTVHYSGKLPLNRKAPVYDSINFVRKASRLGEVEWRTKDGSSCRVRINKFKASNTIRFSGVDDLGCQGGVYPPVKEDPKLTDTDATGTDTGGGAGSGMGGGTGGDTGSETGGGTGSGTGGSTGSGTGGGTGGDTGSETGGGAGAGTGVGGGTGGGTGSGIGGSSGGGTGGGTGSGTGGGTGSGTGTGGIRVESATYGKNCGTTEGNVTAQIAGHCNGKSECRYTVDHRIIGDPTFGCAKTYSVRYQCDGNAQTLEEFLSAEAGLGDKAVLLKCVGSQPSGL